MSAGKILLADDDRYITQILEDMLVREGYSVSVVHDGAAALEAYRKENPDLLILDVSMPLKDGLSVCEEIRRTDQDVLILMLTAQRAQVNTVQGLTVGADDYMTKPFGPKELLARIRSLFRRGHK
ncbi:MAG TPA: response regulator [Elusimicrobiota bacterium]|nr:response regulator [Elusimicrobiota bacterium]